MKIQRLLRKVKLICNPLLFVIGIVRPIDTPKHLLTITYTAEGTTPPSPYSAEVFEGASYSIASPSLVGYTPETPRVEGVMGEEAVSVTVAYTQNSYQFTITYKDAQGNEVASPYTASLHYGDTYNVTSPTVEGYTCNPQQEIVSGTVPARNVTINVVYTADAVEPTIQPLTITGESQTFEYGGAIPTFRATVTGLLGSDTCDLTFDTSSLNTYPTPGVYSIPISYEITYADPDHDYVYDVTVIPCTLSVVETPTPGPEPSLDTQLDLNVSGSLNTSTRLITFTSTITNTGNIDVYNVEFTCALTGTSKQWVSIASGEQKTVTHTYRVTDADLISGSVICTDEVVATTIDPDNPDITLTEDCTIPTIGYTLTIYYEDASESMTFDPSSYTGLHMYQEHYSVASPEISGYTCDKPIVEGYMPARNINYTVTYMPTAYPPSLE